MKNVFVTGGSGFVGQNVIPILIANGFDVYAIARSDQSAKFVKALGAKPIRDDLTALTEATNKALKQCDYVLHSAAYMDFTYDPEPFMELNVEATKNLLQLSKEAGINKFRLLIRIRWKDKYLLFFFDQEPIWF